MGVWLLLLGCSGSDGTTDATTDLPVPLDTTEPTDSDSAPETGTPPPAYTLPALLSGARIKYLGEGEGDWAGRSAGPLGDVDGDGVPELIVTGLWNDEAGDDAGCIYVVTSGGQGEVDLGSARTQLLGEAEHDAAGVSATGAGDVDGDGILDIVIGADGHDEDFANAGAVYLVSSEHVGTLALSEAAFAKRTGELNGDLLGVMVDGGLDMNGDGLTDVIFGARYHDETGEDAGAAYAEFNPEPGEKTVGGADLTILGDEAGDWLGLSLRLHKDIDGDGLAELVVGAQFESTGGVGAGAVYLFRDAPTGTLFAMDADSRFIGEAAGDQAGRVAGGGDVDGDGLPDIVVAAQSNDEGDVDAGAAYVVSDPQPGDLSLAEASAKFVGDGEGAAAGFRVDVAPDVDMDGTDDIVVGAYLHDGGGEGAGAAYLLLGPIVAGRPLSEADRVWQGLLPGDQAGCHVGGVGDLNADGHGDLLVSSCIADDSKPGAGVVYLIDGAMP